MEKRRKAREQGERAAKHWGNRNATRESNQRSTSSRGDLGQALHAIAIARKSRVRSLDAVHYVLGPFVRLSTTTRYTEFAQVRELSEHEQSPRGMEDMYLDM